MKRRSWCTVLPARGAMRSATMGFRNSTRRFSTSASVRFEARTFSTSPDLPWVALFHESIPSSTSSDWWITYTGASAIVLRSASVTTIATSRMRSRSGTRPDISMSIHTNGVLSCATSLLLRIHRLRARRARLAHFPLGAADAPCGAPSRHGAGGLRRVHPDRGGGSAVVVLHLDRVDRVHAAAGDGFPALDRAALQPLHASRAGEPAQTHRGAHRALRLPRRGALRDGRLAALEPRQRVLHRLRAREAHCLLRHADRAPHARGDRGGARARAGPLRAGAHPPPPHGAPPTRPAH